MCAASDNVKRFDMVRLIAGLGLATVLVNVAGAAMLVAVCEALLGHWCCFVGLGVLCAAVGAEWLCRSWTLRVATWTDRHVTPLLGRVLRPRVICEGCLQYSHPDHAHYEHGGRYCEHCGREILPTTTWAMLAFAFGTPLPEVSPDVLVVANPQVDRVNHPLDVAELYIDTTTCDHYRLEQCVTHLLTYPPCGGVQGVRIVHSGELQQLGDHLHNVIRKTFTQIEPIR